MSVKVYMPMCIDCVHLDLIKEVNGRPVCKAYPEGIPSQIWEYKSKLSTDKNTPCQNGYKFEHIRTPQTAD